MSKRKSPGFKDSIPNYFDSIPNYFDSIPNYFDTFGEVFSIYANNLFKNISINMNRLVFALIINFYKQYPQKITEKEYNRLLAYFMFTDYKKIKNMKPYRMDYPLGYVTILDLIILPNQINTVDYLESRYNTCSLIDTHLCAITFRRFEEEYWGNALLRT